MQLPAIEFRYQICMLSYSGKPCLFESMRILQECINFLMWNITNMTVKCIDNSLEHVQEYNGLVN